MAVLRKPGLSKPKSKPAAVIGKKKPGSPFKRPARADADDDFGSAGTTRRASGVFGQAQAEKQRQELASLKPYNCKVPVGGSLEVYILDEGDPWARYEHKVGGSATSSGTDYPCIKDGNEACPLCQREGKEGRYIMYLTCVVPKESYRKQDGTEVTRRFSKKLFPITTKMAQKYQRLFEKHKGSLRGAVLLLSRDQKMDPSTGNDVDVVRFLTEKQITQYATGMQVNDPDQRDRIKKAGIDKAYDYDKVMPRPSAKELAQMVGMKGGGGGGAVGGSDFNDDDPDNFSSTEDNWGA